MRLAQILKTPVLMTLAVATFALLAPGVLAESYAGTCRFADDPTRVVHFRDGQATFRVDSETLKYYNGYRCSDWENDPADTGSGIQCRREMSDSSQALITLSGDHRLLAMGRSDQKRPERARIELFRVECD